MARKPKTSSRRAPRSEARDEALPTVVTIGPAVVTANTAGSIAAAANDQFILVFNSITGTATIKGDGTILYNNINTFGSDFVVTVQASANCNLHLGYGWDGTGEYTIAKHALTANTPVTITTKIPGAGGLNLGVIAVVDANATVTWTNGVLTTSQQNLVPAQFDPYRTAYDVVLTNTGLTATGGPGEQGFPFTANGYECTLSLAGDPTTVYLEVQLTMLDAIDMTWGLSGPASPPGPAGGPDGEMGGPNSFGFFGRTGQVYMNSASHPQGGGPGSITSPFFADGDWIGVAINFPAKTIKTRNVTQNGPYTIDYSFAAITPAAQYFGVGFYRPTVPTNNQHAKVNFDGPFIGAVPTGYVTWKNYNFPPPPTPPQEEGPPGFTEDPAIFITFDAIIADGSYTSTDLNDRIKMPFSVVRWGNGQITANRDLLFLDAVVDDIPQLSITLTADGPSDNAIWGEWDNSGNIFLITKTHIPGPGSTVVPIGSIQIAPPTPQPFNSGFVLTLYISCSSGTVFSWKDGHVFDTEAALAWPPIEEAFNPPSVMGIPQPVIASSEPGTQATFPNFTPLLPPPLVGAGGTVGQAVAPASVPPSTAGFPLIKFGTGSATAPTLVSWFPHFTTTFPAPTVVVSNVWTVPTFAGGVWTSTLPPQTPTTPCVPVGGWGLPGPSGSGPGPPSYPTPPGTGLPHHDLSTLEAVNDNGEDPPTEVVQHAGQLR